MFQQEFELQHSGELLAKGPLKIWRLKIKHAMAVSDQSPTKRTLERWISVIPWPETSNQPYQQID